ncbi:MAG: hypothetical protein ABR574_00650 [Cryomorphaceae bacterium]|nr:hypothetical protein [Flavobacteriales bacterium]
MYRKVLIVFTILIFGAGHATAQNLDNPGKPVTISGSLGGNLSFYDMNGIPARRNPYGYSLFGNVNLRIYGVSLPFSVAINQQGSRFSQPFRQIGVSPQYKWAKLHLGHRIMRFSEFTLNNVTFLGAGTELTPGKFRFSAMIGRFREARESAGDLFRIPQYERNGYAISAGYGKETYVDVVFFKAADKRNSISNPDEIEGLATPEANTAIGLKGGVEVVKHRLRFEYDVGASAFTRNLNATALDLTSGTLSDFRNLADINQSSNVAGAANTALRYRNGAYNAGLEYRYIQPGYQSLGVNYLLSDLEMITVSGGGQFFENKVGVQASYGKQNNNLSERNFATTGRDIGSLNVTVRATEKLNINAGYSNFSIYQTLILDTLFADSVVIDQTNHQLNLSATYLIMGDGKVHSIGINTNFQDLSDRRETAEVSSATQMINVNLSYGLRFNSSGIGLRGSASYQDFASQLIGQQRYAFSLGGSGAFFDKKLTLRLSQTYNLSVLEMRDNDHIHSTRITAGYKVAARHTVSLSAASTSRQGNNDFTESRVSVGYRMQF